MAQVILAAVEERVELGAAGRHIDGLRGAAEWAGGVLTDVLEDALFWTVGSALDYRGPEKIRSDAAAAEAIYSGAGALLLLEAADWAEAGGDLPLISALGVETPEQVATGVGFRRWVDRCRPGEEPDLEDLAEAAVIALAQVLPGFARATTEEVTRAWLDPHPGERKAPGGAEVGWLAIAQRLMTAIDAGFGLRKPAPTADDFRRRATALLAECHREALLEVVQDALFGIAQWVELDIEDEAGIAATMDSVYPRAGSLWKAVETDLAFVGGWYSDLSMGYQPEPLSAVRQAPAIGRWLGESRWSNGGAIDYVAAALSICTHDAVGSAFDRTNDETIELWACGSLASALHRPHPRHWPPRGPN